MRRFGTWSLRLTPLRRLVWLVLASLILATGCLPYSCQRQPNESVYPSDSLSRRVAEKAPVDTLRTAWTTRGTDAHPLEHPRTVRFLDDGTLAASDVEQNSVFRFGPDGAIQREVRSSAFSVPYLIGARGDTLVVFNAETDRIDLVADGRRLSDRSMRFDRPRPESLVYMVATDATVYAKVVGRRETPFILRLDDEGGTAARISLRGPYWRHAGFLRTWGEQILSLSGFRPEMRLLPRGFGPEATADSLSLVGFDSPMLERSYAFGEGDVTEAPLLSPAAAPVGDTLFVLNLRPGWVQIDAYDREGHLRRRLVERHEGANSNFYPNDVDARRVDAGYVFAVAVQSPEPRLKVFRWETGRDGPGAGGPTDAPQK